MAFVSTHLWRLGFATVCVLAFVVPPADAQVSSAVSPAADPLQFYVFSFTDTPASEAAQDVVVGALAYDLEIDPAVDALVTFRADGWYSSDALLKDFGTALLDQDIALVRLDAGSYALAPRANAPVLMARGGAVMSLAEPETANAPLTRLTQDEPQPVYGSANWWDGAAAALAVFFAGAAAGAAALIGAQMVWRRAQVGKPRLVPPALRLTDQRPQQQALADTAQPDPELVIPRFEPRP